MKKMFMSFLLCLTCLCSYGQLQGSFSRAQDGHIYFYLSNPTGYQIPVAWGVYNFDKNEKIQNQGVMTPGEIFIFGPNAHWIWEKGERFAVTYSNGQTIYWTCPESDRPISPSFRGKWKKVSVKAQCSQCSCKVYRGYYNSEIQKYQGDCENIVGMGHCGEPPSKHGLPE